MRHLALPLLAGLLLAAGTSAQDEKKPPVVEVVRLKETTRIEIIQAEGVVVPLKRLTIRPEASGAIVKAAFTGGDRVHKGELLYQLDDRTAKAELAQAQ